MPNVLELMLIEKYYTRYNDEVIVYKDLNTKEVFKIFEKDNRRSLNSVRLINLSKEKLVIVKEPHIYDSNYIIENWIHHFGKK